MEVERALRENGVLVWAGDGRIRLSVHAYNDEADVARALAVLEGPDGARRRLTEMSSGGTAVPGTAPVREAHRFRRPRSRGVPP